MESDVNTIARYHSFHDWYLCGLSADMVGEIVELKLMFDNRKDRARVLFKGATRCLVNDFLIQNIIYSMDVLSDYDSEAFKQARSALDKSYPWGRDKAPKQIVSISASIGADLLIEFESIEVISEQPM